MVYGVGIDIENHQRFKKYTDAAFNPEHLTLIFSAEELANYKLADNHLFYALSFSCKEAFFKAFGSDEVLLTDIQLIFNDVHDIQNVNILFAGAARTIIKKHALSVNHKFSCTDTNVIFEVILEC